MNKAKKSPGCLTRIFQFFFIFLVLALLFGVGNDSTETTSSSGGTIRPTATVKATQKPTTAPTIEPTAAPTIEPTAEPFTIVLTYPELGEYGRYYVMNGSVEKAEEQDKETLIQCFVPAGDYTLTNVGKYPTCVFIYSEETVITEYGWEEAADGWASKILQVGDSCEITVNEGYYINLQENDVFKLVAAPSAEAKLDQYISKFALTEECRTVIMEHLPDFHNFKSIEQEGTQAYSIFTNDDTEYFLTVSKDKEPLCLQSAEEDYDSRTRYYDKFAK